MSSPTIKTVSNRLSKQQKDISLLKNAVKERNPRPSVCWGKWPVRVYRPTVSPDIQSKVVLTDSTWQYVEIAIQKKGDSSDALFYWQQARNFFEASLGLDIISRPLTLYYCLLNATKALLEVKAVGYDLAHGVSGSLMDGHTKIKNEYIKLHVKGVLSGLAQYLQERPCK